MALVHADKGSAKEDVASNLDVNSSEACELPLKNPLKIMDLNDTKAGMEGLDKQHINKIIQEASVGSKYYCHKQKNQERLDQRIKQLKETLSALTDDQITKATLQMDQLATKLEANRDLSRTIVHVDMDAFYAAVEMRDNPDLRDVPMAVGSNSMLSTSNYIARKFGVRAAMPGFIGKKLCPNLIIVPCNFTKYRSVSSEIREIFAKYDSKFCPMSLDEAYLDITYYLEQAHTNDSTGSGVTAEEVVQEIRRQITETTQLTGSAGIAPNTRLAKICSDQNKPNGQYLLPPDREAIISFVHELPIRKVNGIGNATEQLLNAVGIKTCRDLWEKRGYLPLLFSECSYEFYLQVALGLGSTDVAAWNESERKSISCERTFGDMYNRDKLLEICHSLCEELSSDVSKKCIAGKSVTLKIKTDCFVVKTKVTQLPVAASDTATIFKAAERLLLAEINAAKPKKLVLRLMGVRLSNLSAVTNVDRKQSTLDELIKGTPSTLQWICPICQNEIEASSLQEKNSHIDDCLGKSDDGSATDDMSSSSCKDSDSKCGRGTSDQIESVTDFENTVTCPVCFSKLGSISEVDASCHVENCLSLQPLKGITSGSKRSAGAAVSGSSKKLKSSHKPIESYFKNLP